MQIEHITLGGNSSLRISDAIFPETIELLKPFQIREGSMTLPFPRAEFSVKITATKQGAIFDITHNSRIAITNVCGFDDEYKATLFSLVQDIHRTMKFGDPRLPVMTNWLYSIPIDPFALSGAQITIAGEVELYIYYSLYLARQ